MSSRWDSGLSGTRSPLQPELDAMQVVLRAEQADRQMMQAKFEEDEKAQMEV